MLAGWEYTYNDANMVMTETRQHLLDGMSNPFVDTHTRDSAHRSITFDRDSGAYTLSTRIFDGAGKMIDFGDEATAVEVAVDDSMSQYVDLDPNGMPMKPRSYDDLGNLIDDESGRWYEYDAFGRLVYVWDAGPTLLAWYLYDAHDRRILTVRGMEVLQFAYGGDGRVLDERLFLNAFEDPLRQYVWDETSGRVMQMRTTERVFEEEEEQAQFMLPARGPNLGSSSEPASLGGEWVKTNSYHFYQHNSRGDVGLVTGARGGVTEYQTYSWLGRMDVLDENGDPVTGNVSTVGNPYGFAGMRIAHETVWWSNDDWWPKCKTPGKWEENWRLLRSIFDWYDPRVGESIITGGSTITGIGGDLCVARIEIDNPTGEYPAGTPDSGKQPPEGGWYLEHKSAKEVKTNGTCSKLGATPQPCKFDVKLHLDIEPRAPVPNQLLTFWHDFNSDGAYNDADKFHPNGKRRTLIKWQGVKKKGDWWSKNALEYTGDVPCGSRQTRTVSACAASNGYCVQITATFICEDC